MEKAVVLIPILIILLISISFLDTETNQDTNTQIYSGPVPEWADEQCFRETGYTIEKGEVCESWQNM